MPHSGLLALTRGIPDGFEDPFLQPGLDPTAPDQAGFETMFGIVMALVVLAAVVSIAIAVRRGARYLHHGIDPTTVDVDLQAKLLRSQALAPAAPAPVADADGPGPRAVAERLAELDRLRDAGTITDEEHAAARARVIADV